MKIKLVIADDHPVLLSGVIHEISQIPSFEIVGTARNSTALIELISLYQCDILITDYVMPGDEYGDGMMLLTYLKRHYPDLKIIVLSTIDNAAIVNEILRAGVESVLNKVDEITHLISAIHAVYTGATYLSPSLKAVYNNRNSLQTYGLSSRELEVIRLYVSGESITEIAERLSRTKQTISAQKNSAMRKLGLKRDAGLFRYAYETGFSLNSKH